MYDPEVVAESIVFAAEHPRRDIFVGGGGKMFDILQRISPPLVDWLMTRGDKIYRGSDLRHARRRRQPLPAPAGAEGGPRAARRQGEGDEPLHQGLRVASDAQAPGPGHGRSRVGGVGRAAVRSRHIEV